MQSKEKEKAIHIRITLIINADASWQFSDPRVQDSIDISIPFDFFNSDTLAKYIASRIKEMDKELPKAIEEYNIAKQKEAQTS